MKPLKLDCDCFRLCATVNCIAPYEMPSPLRSVPLLLCVVMAVMGGARSSDATELFLANKVDLVNKEDAALVESLIESLRRKARRLPDRFTTKDIHFARADLNGDGVEEIIAMAATLFTCGNAPDCETSIYKKTITGLRYIGSMDTTEKIGISGYFVDVEDNWINGWRVLNNGTYRYCWLNKTDTAWDYRMNDILGMPHEPGQAGYFTSVDIKDDCPKEIPKPQ